MRTPQEFKDLILKSFKWYFDKNLEHLYESFSEPKDVVECSDFMTFKESKEENIFNPDQFSVTFETYWRNPESYEDEPSSVIYKVTDLKTKEFVYIPLFIPFVEGNAFAKHNKLLHLVKYEPNLMFPIEKRVVEWEFKDVVSPVLIELDSENERRFCIQSRVDGATYYDFYNSFASASTAIHRYRFLSQHDFTLSDSVLDIDLISVKNKDLKYLVSDSFIKEHYRKV